MFSRLAGAAELVVLNWWVLHATGDPAMVGVVTAARLVPLVVSAPLGGTLADRVDPFTVVTVMSATSALFTAVLGAGVASSWPLWVLCAILVVRGLVTAAEPAMRQIAVARLAGSGAGRDAATVRGMADLSTLSTLCLVLGPLLSGVLLSSAGPGWALAVLAGLQAAAAALTVRARVASRATPASAPRVGSVRGVRAVFADRLLLAQVILALGPMLTVFPYTAMVPVMVQAAIGSDPAAVALASAAAALGAVATTLVLRRRPRIDAPGRTAALAAAATAAPLLACAVAVSQRSAPGLLLGLAALGAIGQLYRTMNRAAVALRAPAGAQGAVLGVSAMDRVLIPVGALVCGVVAGAWGPGAMLALMAVGNLVLIVPALLLRRG